MKVYVRFMDDTPNGVFECESFKVYEGEEKSVFLDGNKEIYREIVVELDDKSVLRDVLDIESI